MGSKPLEKKKRKKKGRPSLLDLQKRTLRLEQTHQNPNPNPNPNSRPRSPPSRRPTRRNPDPVTAEEEEVDADGEDSGGKRREKELNLVLRTPHRSPADSGSDGRGERSVKRRRIDDVGDGDSEKARRSPSEGTNCLQDLGPTTPLPDKKLLVFILDRLQKKDTYGVFSEPVDPEELPDYHEVIEHPMDFGTVREKLPSGAYLSLEQFEKDVFLICSNAMTYNAPHTIYYRQARNILELAKKNFENLRQESDEDESEAKVVRRGRPPFKNTIKNSVGKFTNHSAPDYLSNETPGDAGGSGHLSNRTHGLSKEAAASDKPNAVGAGGLHKTETNSWTDEHKTEREKICTGSTLKAVPTNYGKKPSVTYENRRKTYKQSLLSKGTGDSPILTIFGAEKKQLVPIGIHMEHSYARSLARFSVKLGPIGWKIAAQLIERALPSGVKFGQGWVGECEPAQLSDKPIDMSSPPNLSSQTEIMSCSTTSAIENLPESQGPPLSCSASQNNHSNRAIPPATVTATSDRSSDAFKVTEHVNATHEESHSNSVSDARDTIGVCRKPLFQLHQTRAMHQSMNGLNCAIASSLSPHAEKMIRPFKSHESFGTDMVSRNNNTSRHQSPHCHTEFETTKLGGKRRPINSDGSLPESAHVSHGPWRGISLNSKLDSAPPDLNVGFHAPRSPASGVTVDSQQPDLALQL